MEKAKHLLKTTGKILLGILVFLGLIVGGFFIWLQGDPEEITECQADYRLFEHALGISCIPNNPERILPYGTAPSQFLVAIEQPMAMTTVGFDVETAADIPGLYERLREVNEGVLDLGFVEGTAVQNIELLLQIQPDLIISEWAASEDVVKTVELVTPAVLLTDSGDWKEITQRSGDAIGRSEQAQELIVAYEERVQILREQFDDPADVSISLVRLWPDNYWVMLENSFSGQIIQEVGFSVPPPQLEIDDQVLTFNSMQIRFSKERYDLVDADFILLFPATTGQVLIDTGYTPRDLTEEFQSEPLFQFLEAPQAGNVLEAGVHWNVTGIYSAHAVLDDLFRYVAGVDPEEVAPNPLRLE
ncbi:MAG: hypothetical protein AAF490_15810 [Chloroflexota bacterium]